MKVLGIMGSPRIKGNTDLLLDESLKGAESAGAEIEKLIVEQFTIDPCKENYGCTIDGICTIKDDMDQIYPKLIGCDRIVIASPMFFYSFPSQMKALIDRCQALWARKYILKREIPSAGRKGFFIGVGATRGKNLFDGSRLTLRYFFDVIGVEYADELLIRSVDQKGEILEHPDSLKAARDLGVNLACG